MLSFKNLNKNMAFPHRKLAYSCLNVLLSQSCLKFKFLQVHPAAEQLAQTQKDSNRSRAVWAQSDPNASCGGRMSVGAELWRERCGPSVLQGKPRRRAPRQAHILAPSFSFL